MQICDYCWPRNSSKLCRLAMVLCLLVEAGNVLLALLQNTLRFTHPQGIQAIGKVTHKCLQAPSELPEAELKLAEKTAVLILSFRTTSTTLPSLSARLVEFSAFQSFNSCLLAMLPDNLMLISFLFLTSQSARSVMYSWRSFSKVSKCGPRSRDFDAPRYTILCCIILEYAKIWDLLPWLLLFGFVRRLKGSLLGGVLGNLMTL